MVKHYGGITLAGGAGMAGRAGGAGRERSFFPSCLYLPALPAPPAPPAPPALPALPALPRPSLSRSRRGLERELRLLGFLRPDRDLRGLRAGILVPRFDLVG